SPKKIWLRPEERTWRQVSKMQFRKLTDFWRKHARPQAKATGRERGILQRRRRSCRKTWLRHFKNSDLAFVRCVTAVVPTVAIESSYENVRRCDCGRRPDRQFNRA